MKNPTETSISWLKYALIALMTLALIAPAQAESFLWDAVTNNDLGKTKTLIAFGAGVNQKNSYGNPILHHAVSVGNAEMVELLLSKGAEINLKGQFDRVALHYANKKGMAKILLAHGAIADAPTNYGETPLHWAAQGINSMGAQVDLVEFAETLIKNGADVDKKTGEGRSHRTPLSYAAEANNLAVAKVLISHGADVEGGGSLPLSAAGINGDYVGMAQLLVENGANVNATFPTGETPLMTAAGRGNIKVTNYLLAQGANPNAAGKSGLTALYSAASSDYGASAAETLLKHGANADAKYLSGLTPLHQAASEGAIKVIEVLLAHGATVDAKTENGTTPLCLAIRLGGVQKGGRGVAEILLKNGADPNAKNPGYRQSPFHEAILRHDIELVKLLITYGAKADDQAFRIARSDEMTALLKSIPQ